MKRLVVADSQPLCRAGLATYLKGKVERIVEASDIAELYTVLAQDHSIGFLIIDSRLPGLDSGADIIRLKQRFPSLRVLLMSNDVSRDAILAALEWGVHGYIWKGALESVIKEALLRVLSGAVYVPSELSECAAPKRAVNGLGLLTERESEIASLVAQGKATKEIARELGIAPGTVKVHVNNVYRKFGVHNRLAAANVMRSHALA